MLLSSLLLVLLGMALRNIPNVGVSLSGDTSLINLGRIWPLSLDLLLAEGFIGGPHGLIVLHNVADTHKTLKLVLKEPTGERKTQANDIKLPHSSPDRGERFLGKIPCRTLLFFMHDLGTCLVVVLHLFFLIINYN